MPRRAGLLLLVLSFLGLVAPSSALAAPADAAAPATIRICRSSSGGVDVVPFKDYVKIVLPVEFPAHWPVESLRAGAVAVKSYAWYHVLHPISSRCDIGDTTRYQLYEPDYAGRRTAKSDGAVEDTWGLRLDDSGRNDVAYAQYCSGGCKSHYRYAGEGKFIEQEVLRDMAADGWQHVDLLNHFYRNLPMRLYDWTTPFAVSSSEDVISLTKPPASFTVGITGLAAGDRRGQVNAYAVCTADGVDGAHLMQTVGVTANADGAPIATFDQLGGLVACEDEEATVSFQFVVNDHLVSARNVRAWRRWTSEVERPVDRVAETADPVAASVEVSLAVFEPIAPEAESSNDLDVLMGMVLGDGEPSSDAQEPRFAQYAVLARSDSFPDALGATALAGTDGPILLTPGGPDAPLATTVGDELQRILELGSEVRIIGGLSAVSQRAQDEVEALGFTTRRISGADRIATAQALADELLLEDGTAPTVIVVRGFPDTTAGWADAIAIGPWAARTGTPILVTPDKTFAPSVEAWIENPAHGVQEVIIIGGTAAVPGTAETKLENVKVTRVSGARRDATALAVADQLWGTRGTPDARHVYVADVYGRGGWAFAVTAAVPAAIGDAAALTVADLVPPTTSGEWLDARPEVGATIIGGDKIVSPTVEASLAGTNAA